MTQSEFHAWLALVGPEIDAVLRAAVEESALAAAPARLREAMAHALLGGGKRIRPALCLLVAEACGGSRERALPAAAACEMIHAYSLIHDDLPCMDDDVLRRGQPTTHVLFGKATAVLAGDALQALAFETLAAQSEGSLALSQSRLLARAVGAEGMVGGQQLDMDGEGRKLPIDDVLAIHAAKTGALFAAALQLGALSAGEDPAPWRLFAQSLGRLFQISDDVLDATRSTRELGKTAGKDGAAEKATVVGALGLDQARKLIQREVQEALDALATLAPVRHQGVLADLPIFLGARGA